MSHYLCINTGVGAVAMGLQACEGSGFWVWVSLSRARPNETSGDPNPLISTVTGAAPVVSPPSPGHPSLVQIFVWGIFLRMVNSRNSWVQGRQHHCAIKIKFGIQSGTLAPRIWQFLKACFESSVVWRELSKNLSSNKGKKIYITFSKQLCEESVTLKSKI